MTSWLIRSPATVKVHFSSVVPPGKLPVSRPVITNRSGVSASVPRTSVVYVYRDAGHCLPGANRGGPVTRFALVDHRCVIGEQGNDRLDLAIGVEYEVAADHVRDPFEP
jgi:hypothetical protein